MNHLFLFSSQKNNILRGFNLYYKWVTQWILLALNTWNKYAAEGWCLMHQNTNFSKVEKNYFQNIYSSCIKWTANLSDYTSENSICTSLKLNWMRCKMRKSRNKIRFVIKPNDYWNLNPNLWMLPSFINFIYQSEFRKWTLKINPADVTFTTL